MNTNQKKILYKNMGILCILIVVCAILSRCSNISRGETLSEYAAKQEAQNAGEPGDQNPDPENPVQESPLPSPSPTPSETSEPSPQPEKTPAPEDSPAETENNNMEESEAPMPERVTYQNGFFYEPLSETVKNRITGISYPEDDSDIAIHYDDLRYVNVLYYNFHDVERTGELICHKDIAQDVVEIFYELYRSNYQIEKICLIDEYSGDDHLSMLDNNTSCFNYRVVDNSSSLSKHAYGLAIDLNPFYNPYITYNADGSINVSPEGSEPYADREADFAYKIDKNDLAYQLFTEHGFTWGGSWNSCKDYQHFQKPLD